MKSIENMLFFIRIVAEAEFECDDSKVPVGRKNICQKIKNIEKAREIRLKEQQSD